MRKKNKSIYIVLIVTLLICITIGYSVLNSTLIINGTSNIEKNTWDVHFENVRVNSGGVIATIAPTISGNTTISNFELELDKPGDFYEFTVDVVNNGTIDAMVSSVTKIPDLTIEQQKYLNYIIEYQNEEQITTNQLVKSGEFVRLKVKVEYKKDITAADLPQNSEILNLGFTLNYVQSDGNGSSVKDNGIFYAIADGSISEIGTIVTIGTEKIYTIGTEGDNVKLLSVMNITLDEEPKQSLNASSTPFSSDEQHGTTYSDYNGSIVEGYVNNYVEFLTNKYGFNIIEYRLVNEEEFDILSDLFTSDDVSHFFWTNYVYDSERLYTYHTMWHASCDFYDYNVGISPVIILSKKDIKVIYKPVADGDINEIGTIVTIGTEKFYTIGTDSENVILLSMYNLYVGGSHPPNGNYTPYGDEATGMQEENMNGRHEGNTVFSNVGTSYSGSVVEEYVDNYKSLLESKFGINIAEARLITSEELSNPQTFACEVPDYVGLDSYGSCSDEYPWIYEIGYWVKDFYDDNFNWAIVQDEGIMTIPYTDYNGVRPVIVISKDYF